MICSHDDRLGPRTGIISRMIKSALKSTSKGRLCPALWSSYEAERGKWVEDAEVQDQYMSFIALKYIFYKWPFMGSERGAHSLFMEKKRHIKLKILFPKEIVSWFQ